MIYLKSPATFVIFTIGHFHTVFIVIDVILRTREVVHK